MKVEEQQLAGITPRSTLGRYSNGFMPRVKQGAFVFQRAIKPAKV